MKLSNFFFEETIGTGTCGSAYKVSHAGKTYAMKVVTDETVFSNPLVHSVEDAVWGLNWEFMARDKHVDGNDLEGQLEKANISGVSYLKFHCIGRLKIPLSQKQRTWIKNEEWVKKERKYRQKTGADLYDEAHREWFNQTREALQEDFWKKVELPSFATNVLIMQYISPEDVGDAQPVHAKKFDQMRNLQALKGTNYFFDHDHQICNATNGKLTALNFFCLKNGDLVIFDFGMWALIGEDKETLSWKDNTFQKLSPEDIEKFSTEKETNTIKELSIENLSIKELVSTKSFAKVYFCDSSNREKCLKRFEEILQEVKEIKRTKKSIFKRSQTAVLKTDSKSADKPTGQSQKVLF